MAEMSEWIPVCAASEIDAEDVYRFDHEGRPYAIYHAKSGFFATDDVCSHEYAHLSDGLVIGDVIECPLHQGRFHIPTGKALSPPACAHMKTYPVKNENGALSIQINTP
jgi:3-phenylpropionate/trans-cinnamate dioxygenase ferredoxin subunit